MDISVEQLIAGGIHPTQAKRFAAALAPALARFDIGTPARAAAFLGQCCVESAAFTRLEENLFYTTAARIASVWPSRFRDAAAAAPFARLPQRLANRVYAGRNGNGDEASGDGWRYRGRGLKQLTGRRNYRDAAQGCGRDYLARPELVQEPEDAAMTAAFFWHKARCNEAADAGDHDAVTRLVNGPAMLAAAQRRARARAFLRALTS